jgi:hypothetical protein
MSSTASGLPRTDVTAPAYVDDGESLLDVDIDDLPDHPWRKAGTVLSDYFNYGFDEATWKVYCARQKSGREEREKERELPFSVRIDSPLVHRGPYVSYRSLRRCRYKRPTRSCRSSSATP